LGRVEDKMKKGIGVDFDRCMSSFSIVKNKYENNIIVKTTKHPKLLPYALKDKVHENRSKGNEAILYPTSKKTI